VGTITAKDGTRIAYKDWGKGRPILFSHGWPLSGDTWDAQTFFFGQSGYRAIAHDWRGHGKSDQPWSGNDMDQYADDLADLIEKPDLNELVLRPIKYRHCSFRVDGINQNRVGIRMSVPSASPTHANWAYR
jgi:non-heme chloroperoxidase